MPSLKELRVRITSVKSTQKITSAMKMVAAAKLRRAQEAAEAARPYALRMERMLGTLTEGLATIDGAPRLLAGSGKDDVHLLVVVSADRGLCGGFNNSIVRETRKQARELQSDGKSVKILCLGRKARDALSRDLGALIVDSVVNLTRAGVDYDSARGVALRLSRMAEDGEFDVCTVIFNRFKSVISQVVTARQLVPFPLPETAAGEQAPVDTGPKAVPILEPSDDEILAELLPRNLAVQVFQSLLESFASEQGARMTAMDSATRNAGEMIDDLTLSYNRTRQALITKELIEIISGAEAV